MSTYRSAKGTTINIPDNLTAQQIAKIKADADAGYGNRAQASANQLGKTAAPAPAPTGGKNFSAKGQDLAALQTMLDRTNAEIKRRGGAGKAPELSARLKKIQAAIKRGGAAGGDTGTTGGTLDDQIQDDGSINDKEGLKKGAGHTFDPNDPYWKELYNTTYQNQYELGTRGLAERQARDLEDAKQEAANRGLPYDPGNKESAYGRTIGGVTDRYDTLYKDATNQAYAAAQGVYGTQGGLSNEGFVAELQAALGISEAEARAKQLEITKYGIDEDTKTKLASIRASKAGSGGGGSGGSGKSSGGSSSGGDQFVIL